MVLALAGLSTITSCLPVAFSLRVRVPAAFLRVDFFLIVVVDFFLDVVDVFLEVVDFFLVVVFFFFAMSLPGALILRTSIDRLYMPFRSFMAGTMRTFWGGASSRFRVTSADEREAS